MNYTLPLALMLAFHTCQAENFVVENLQDSGAGSLRAAIISANANSDPDTITFADSLSTNGPHVITIKSALSVTGTIEIIGPGRDTLFINGGGNQQVLILSGSTANNPHRISNLTIQNGSASQGGANIRVLGNIQLTNCAILNGVALARNPADADGGGLFHSGGTLTVNACLFQGNRTIGNSSQGGGLYTQSGTATISNSRILDNTTNGSVSEGGGIGSRSITTIENCEISGNDTLNVFSGGGGIFSSNNITMRQCTISDNSVGSITGTSGYSIGGAFASVGGSATFESCTITENSAPSNIGQGAGVSSIGSGIISFRNCIVAGNGSSDLDAPQNAQINYQDNGYNIFGSVTNTRLNNSNNRNSTSSYGISNPWLSSLAFHGGITRTHVPLPNSPALNSGPTTASPVYDQRGTDFPRLIGTALDIGASERQDFTDADSDGIPDAIENLIPEIATSSGDADQDGISDLVEYRLSGSAAVLDPTLRPSLSIQPLGDNFQLEFPTTPNREYRIVYNTDLVSTRVPLQAEFQRFTQNIPVTMEASLDEPRAFFFLEGRIPAEPTQ